MDSRVQELSAIEMILGLAYAGAILAAIVTLI